MKQIITSLIELGYSFEEAKQMAMEMLASPFAS